MSEWIVLASRWIHICCAIVLVGGTFFTRFVLIPAANTLSEPEHDNLRQEVLKRWRMVVHIGVTLFLVSGLFNYIMVMAPKHKGDGPYHMLMGIKMMLGIGVFGLAEVLAGRSHLAQKLRQNYKVSMGLALLLAFIIIALSNYLKIRGVVG